MTTNKHKSGKKLLGWFDNKFFADNLNETLKKQSARRKVVFIGLLLPFAFGYIFGYATWSLIAPNPATTLEKLLQALFWISMFPIFLLTVLIEQAVQSVIAIPGQPFDERQRLLNLEARSDAYSITAVIMIVAMLFGLAMLIATIAGYLPWSAPLYGGLHFYAGACSGLFLLSKLSPSLLLAWRLPDELVDEGDD